MTEPPPGPFDPPSGSPHPPRRWPRPASGGRIAAGIAIAVLIGLVVIDAGSSAHVMSSSARVTAVGQLLVLAGFVAAGVVILRRHDRGMGLGLIIGAALMALCGPLGGLGPCYSVFGG